MISRRTLLASTPIALVAGCAPGTGGFVPPTPASLQQAIINACGFFAELGPLAQLIASFVPVPGVSTTAAVVNQLAMQVCAAVTPVAATPQARAGGSVSVVVNGVPIVGRFVR